MLTVRPTEVRIVPTSIATGNTFESSIWIAGQQTEFMCESTGSRPPARLVWFIRLNHTSEPYPLLTSGFSSSLAEHQPLHSSRPDVLSLLSDQQNDNGSWTRSRLRLQLQPQMNFAALICRAQNPNLPHLSIEHVMFLNVQCKFILAFFILI